jgi:hypothetical protein
MPSPWQLGECRACSQNPCYAWRISSGRHGKAWGDAMRENEERWKLLCEQAAKEQNPQKLIALTREINFLLLTKRKRLSEPLKKSPADSGT